MYIIVLAYSHDFLSYFSFFFFFLMIRRPPRSTLFPTRRSSDLPSVAESVPGFNVSNWTGLFAPAKTSRAVVRSEEHTSDSSHITISYAVFCLKKKKKKNKKKNKKKKKKTKKKKNTKK